MYSNARCLVHVNQLREEFELRFKLTRHLFLALFPIKLTLKPRLVICNLYTQIPGELLYAGDLVIVTDTLEECFEKHKSCNWLSGKLMVSSVGLDW